MEPEWWLRGEGHLPVITSYPGSIPDILMVAQNVCISRFQNLMSSCGFTWSNASTLYPHKHTGKILKHTNFRSITRLWKTSGINIWAPHICICPCEHIQIYMYMKHKTSVGNQTCQKVNLPLTWGSIKSTIIICISKRFCVNRGLFGFSWQWWLLSWTVLISPQTEPQLFVFSGIFGSFRQSL